MFFYNTFNVLKLRDIQFIFKNKEQVCNIENEIL
jgi:hypothetical protein